MALPQPGPPRLPSQPATSRLLATPSRASLPGRARSSVLRSFATRVLPRSVLFAHGARDGARKRVALTFDDGPDAMTPQYLDVLRRLEVRATFFLVGESAARAPGMVREYVRRGHEVGSHGWTHAVFTGMPRHRLADELTRTAAALPRCAGRPLVRPPRGSLSATSIFRLAKAGYTTVLWSVDSDDCRVTDAQAVQRRVAPERLAPGDVVLLHEQQPWTLAALPAVVGALREDGWELVTVRELME
jgi:peptidoglycan-N-acetylglucosamine deacetylase